MVYKDVVAVGVGESFYHWTKGSFLASYSAPPENGSTYMMVLRPGKRALNMSGYFMYTYTNSYLSDQAWGVRQHFMQCLNYIYFSPISDGEKLTSFEFSTLALN